MFVLCMFPFSNNVSVKSVYWHIVKASQYQGHSSEDAVILQTRSNYRVEDCKANAISYKSEEQLRLSVTLSTSHYVVCC